MFVCATQERQEELELWLEGVLTSRCALCLCVLVKAGSQLLAGLF